MTVKLTKENFKNAVESSDTMLEAASNLNLQFSTFKKYATIFGLYQQKYKRKEGNGKIPLTEILDGLHPSYQTRKLKIRLYESGLKKNECEECKIDSWNSKTIECHLEHIDGNSRNHKFKNLKILCPNCHSQTSTYCGKNKKKILLV